jgi:hypothetical protein
MPALYLGLPLLVLGNPVSMRSCVYPVQTLTIYPAHCVLSPGSCRVNLTPMVFRVCYGLIVPEETA